MNKERVEQVLKNSKLLDLKRSHGWRDTVEWFKKEEDNGFSLNYITKNYSLEQHSFQTEEELLQILCDVETRILNTHEKIQKAMQPLTDKYPEYIKKVNDKTYGLGNTQFAFGLSNVSPAAGEFSEIISFKELDNYSPHNHIGLISSSEMFPNILRRYMICFLCKNEFEKNYDVKNNPWIRGVTNALIDFYLETYRMSIQVEEKGEGFILTFTAKEKRSEQCIAMKRIEGSLEELMEFTASYAKRKRKEDRLNNILK